MHSSAKAWRLLASVAVLLTLAACNGVTEREGHQVPVFAVQDSAVTPDQAEALFAELGAFPEQAVREDGSLLFLDEERYQQLPMQGQQIEGTGDTENETFASEGFDLGALEELDNASPVPSEAQAADEVASALNQAGLHPNERLGEIGEATANTGHGTFEMVRAADGATATAFEMDTHVAYPVRLRTQEAGPVDMIGPGASVKAVLGPEGSATLVHYELYDVEPAENVWVPLEDEATRQCAEAYEPVEGEPDREPANLEAQQSEIQVEADLVYYAPPFEEEPDAIYPYYQCSGVMQVGGENEPTEEFQLRPTLLHVVEEAPPVSALGNEARATQPRRSRSGSDTEPQDVSVHDVGSEWVGESQNLGGSSGNAGGFVDTFQSASGYDMRFEWGDFNAWEQDFKDPVHGGNDTQWVDNVDAVFYTGHANANGFTFPGNMDDGRLRFNEARWGQHDLEWLTLAACGPLQRQNGAGDAWYERWGDAFDGLHLLMAYANVSYDNTREGRIFAEAMLGERPGLPSLKVRQAWSLAATKVQPSDVTYAYMGVANSDGMTGYDDYLWGRGTGGGPDVANEDIVYYWRVSSPS